MFLERATCPQTQVSPLDVSVNFIHFFFFQYQTENNLLISSEFTAIVPFSTLLETKQ